MPNLSTVEIKAFIPARDFEVSKRFYQAIGFTLASDTDEPANQPWAMRDFTLFDPSGVFWRIAQNIPRQSTGQLRRDGALVDVE